MNTPIPAEKPIFITTVAIVIASNEFWKSSLLETNILDA